jgi:hypothetical protein
MPSQSFDKFEDLLGSVDQLVIIHGKLQQGRGRRHEQDAIHRAGVVLAVAAWQAYIEKVLEEGLLHIENHVTAPAGGAVPPPWATSGFLLRKASIKKSIADFNTPNSENVRRLFKETIDFDPWPAWTWRAQRRNWTSQVLRSRTNDWLRIRHSIAHGFDLPSDIQWIRGANGAARLTLGLLQECRKHFHHLVNKTDHAFSDHLRNQHGIPALW